MTASPSAIAGLVPLLTSFHGRIDRRQWWIGFIIVFIGSVVGTLYFNPDMFTSDLDVVPPPQWADTIWQVVWLIPGTAITVKRFNDRAWPWWLGYACGAVGLFLEIAPHYGMLIDPQGDVGGVIVFWGTLAVLLFAIIDNGFFRGTNGANRYGPDPLDRTSAPS